MFDKNKKIRFKGRMLRELNNKIFNRDGHTCIIRGCGRYILPDVKFHHEPCGSNKEDKIERGCLLCDHCHYIRHHGRDGLEEIKQQCVEYLSNLYPKDWLEIKG